MNKLLLALLTAVGLGLIAPRLNAQVAAGSLANTSALLTLAPGSTATIGFVVAAPIAGASGAAPATSLVMIRVVGPSLSNFGISGAVALPQMKVFGPDGKPSPSGVIFLGQIDWNATFAAAGAFALTGGESLGSSVGFYSVLPGAYTVQASDGSGKGGAILVEVYTNDKVMIVPGSPT